MRELLDELRDGGGEAIEVVSASHSPAQYREYAGVGSLPALDPGLRPVWRDWGT
jgi:hypothetical protein